MNATIPVDFMNGFAHSERTPLRTLAGPVPGDTYLTRLAQGAAISLVGRVFGRATSAFTHVILARFLGPQDFGFYAVGWTTLQLGGTLAGLGLDRGVMDYGLDHRETDQHLMNSVLRPSIGLTCVLGLMFGTDLYLCAPWLATQAFGKAHLISVLCWFAPVFCFFRVCASPPLPRESLSACSLVSTRRKSCSQGHTCSSSSLFRLRMGATRSCEGSDHFLGKDFVTYSAKIILRSPNNSCWSCGPNDSGVWGCSSLVPCP